MTYKNGNQGLNKVLTSDANNINRLRKNYKSGNIGWRLIGQNPANYGSIGSNALEFKYT